MSAPYTQQHHYHRIHHRMRGTRYTAHDATAFPTGSLSLAQVPAAYGFTKRQFTGVSTVKIGIGSLGGGVVQADIDAACAALGMAPPRVTILQVGGAVADPVADPDSNVENMLDVIIVAHTWWWLTGTAADITFCVGPNAANGMAMVTEALVAAGVRTVTWSWGSPASGWDPAERARLAAAFAAGTAAGTTFFAASGDNSIDDGTNAPSADYPCADPNVWAVGGTNLQIDLDGAIAVESAWGDGAPGDDGGGGGVDPTIAMPPFQVGVVPGTKRGVPDTSACADPQSGWQISANGSWTVVGGTSAAAPFTATIMSVVVKARACAGKGLLTPTAYRNRATCWNDVVRGSNGDPALPGFDFATGLGSPNAAGLVGVTDWV